MKVRIFVILLIMLMAVMVFASDHGKEQLLTVERVQVQFEKAMAQNESCRISADRIRNCSERLVQRLQERGIETMHPARIKQLVQQEVERYNQYFTSMNEALQEEQMTAQDADVIMTSAVASQDSLALVALYNSTDGPNWKNNTNWLTSEPVATWYGIGVTEGNVTALCLNNNNLDGLIPWELGTLSHLEILYLDENDLWGAIPLELGNLANLMWLDLQSNGLHDHIPPELGNLTNLRGLYLHGNYLNGTIPPELGNLINLVGLDLGRNNFSGTIPEELNSLADLEYFDLSSNDFNGTIPSWIGDLSNLISLELYNNQFSGNIPPELGNLVNLSILDLAGNYLNGSIPSELGNLINLTCLYLCSSDLSGIVPVELGNLIHLSILDLAENNLSGTIPSELGNLINLERLQLFGNSLNGAIPLELGNLVKLVWFDFSCNDLSGPIPAELGNLSNLRFLAFSQNQLTGNIPSELGDLINLEYLYLGNNQLSGTIPSELGDLSSLINLDISDNQLIGMIPPQLGSLTNIKTLCFENNLITGMPDLTALTSLSFIMCHKNRLTFEDLEPNMSLPIHYIPQDSVDIYGPGWGAIGDSITLSVNVGGSANDYEWYRDNILVPPDVEIDELTINPISEWYFGKYHCEITNHLVPDLILCSRKLNFEEGAFGTIDVVVWYDANANGLVDWRERGLAGIKIKVPLEGKPCENITNSSGKSTFRFPAGSYTVELAFENLPEGAVCTTEGPALTVELNQDRRDATVYFGFCGDNVELEADNPVNGPEEGVEISSDDLVVIDGSLTFDNSKTNYDWSNAVDGDEEGWDGTTIAMPDSIGNETVPWVIFGFADGCKYKFNYIKFRTDNGTDDDGAKNVFPAYRIEVLVSTTGFADDDFTSIGIFVDKYSKVKMQWCRLDDYVTARYIKLRLLEPVIPGQWTEIVEFALDNSDKTGPLPAVQDKEAVSVPKDVELLTNYPNPFNPSTNIVYHVTQDAQVSIRIYDLVGKLVAELVQDRQSAGQYEISWNAADLPSGVYFVTMKVGTEKAAKRILLMK